MSDSDTTTDLSNESPSKSDSTITDIASDLAPLHVQEGNTKDESYSEYLGHIGKWENLNEATKHLWLKNISLVLTIVATLASLWYTYWSWIGEK